MLIRSQDKKRLVEALGVEINTNMVKFLNCVFIDVLLRGNGVIKVAQYSTEEKALKVFDMIQEHLSTKIVDFDLNGKITREVYKADFPFQMPKDEDVTV